MTNLFNKRIQTFSDMLPSVLEGNITSSSIILVYNAPLAEQIVP